MTIQVYKSTDQDAPQLTGTAGSLITLLDACLVNGYGSKSAAGWTKEYSDTNKAAYRMSTTAPGSTGMYLYIDDASNSAGRIRGYESMTGIDSGTNAFPLDSYHVGGLHMPKSASASSQPVTWLLIASDRSFYYIVDTNPNNYQFGLWANNLTNGYEMFFGDFKSRNENDQFNCAIISHTAATISNNTYFGYVPSSSALINGHFLARSNDGLATSLNFSKDRVYYRGLALSNTIGQNASLMPNLITQSLDLAQICIGEDQYFYSIRGFLPGFYEPIGGAAITPNSEIQGNGIFSGETFLSIPVHNAGTVGRGLIKITGTWY